jgi:hypothetical protein
MSPAERRELARALATVDYPHPLLGIYLVRGRRLGVLVSIIACTVLAGWIIVLVLTLHRSFHAQHWKGAWIGFDFLLLLAFAATGWAFWRGRQIVIAFLLITATLLCCDAWFDVILDAGSSDVWGSVASAVIVELPLAFLMFNAARRLIRLSALVAVSEAGGPGGISEEDRRLPVWKIPLLGLHPSDRDLRTGAGCAPDGKNRHSIGRSRPLPGGHPRTPRWQSGVIAVSRYAEHAIHRVRHGIRGKEIPDRGLRRGHRRVPGRPVERQGPLPSRQLRHHHAARLINSKSGSSRTGVEYLRTANRFSPRRSKKEGHSGPNHATGPAATSLLPSLAGLSKMMDIQARSARGHCVPGTPCQALPTRQVPQCTSVECRE